MCAPFKVRGGIVEGVFVLVVHTWKVVRVWKERLCDKPVYWHRASRSVFLERYVQIAGQLPARVEDVLSSIVVDSLFPVEDYLFAWE